MITFGYLRLSFVAVLILGWAIVVHSLCVPRTLLSHSTSSSTLLPSAGVSTITSMQTVSTTVVSTSTGVTVLNAITVVSSSTGVSVSTSFGTSVNTSVGAVPITSAVTSSATLSSQQSTRLLSSALPTVSSSFVQASGAPSRSASGVSSAAPSSTSTSSASGSMDGAVQGEASYYTEGKSHPGSCGFIPSDPNFAAVNPQFMPAKCKQCILISYQGKQLKVQATDTCPSCSATKIDLSDAAFQQLDSLSKGIIKIQWKWVPCGAA